MSEALGRLRAATAAHHARVEDALPLLRPGFERPAYQRALERLLGLVEPLEQEIAAEQPEMMARIGYADGRQKAPQLQRDLAAFGLDACACRRLPRSSFRGVLPGARAVGALYVLEGSTLGGQVLARALRERFGADLPLQYFAGYGAATGRRWGEFLAVLVERLESSAERERAIIEGARATFETYQVWLESEPF